MSKSGSVSNVQRNPAAASERATRDQVSSSGSVVQAKLSGPAQKNTPLSNLPVASAQVHDLAAQSTSELGHGLRQLEAIQASFAGPVVQLSSSGKVVQKNDPPPTAERVPGAARRGIEEHVGRAHAQNGAVENAQDALGGSADSRLNEASQGQLRLEQAQLNFTIPPRTVLSAADWEHEVRTRQATQVCVRVSREQLLIWMNPALFLDAQFPVRNMEIHSAGWNFTTGQPETDVQSTGPRILSGIDLSEDVEHRILAILQGSIGSSPMGRPGYDPLADDNLLRNLSRVAYNFENLPSNPLEDVDAPPPANNASVNVAMSARQPINIQQGDGPGLNIPAGGTFGITINGEGNLQNILSQTNAQAGVDAARISSIVVRSDAIRVVSGGSPLVYLRHVVIGRGGQVNLRSWTAVGPPLTNGEGIESLIRLIAGTARLARHGVAPEIGASHTVNSGQANPEIVQGITSAMIERSLSRAICQLARDNANIIPGVDLARSLGI